MKLHGQDGLRLTVADTGIGLAADHLTHLFERFYRVKESADLQPIGTGLGLMLVKELVELQQGTIRVESQPGRGTTFRAWLPYHTVTDPVTVDSATSAQEKVACEEPDLDKQAIDSSQAEAAVLLLVEDNEDMAQFITASLPPTTPCIGPLMDWLGWNKPDDYYPNLIISDVMMPRLALLF